MLRPGQCRPKQASQRRRPTQCPASALHHPYHPTRLDSAHRLVVSSDIEAGQYASTTWRATVESRHPSSLLVQSQPRGRTSVSTMSSQPHEDLNPFQIPDDENTTRKPSPAAESPAASSHSSLTHDAPDGAASTSNRVQEDDDDDGWTGSSSRAQINTADQVTGNTGVAAAASSSPSSVSRATFASPPSVIEIVDAQKSGDGGSSFIVYVIRNGSTEAKRRYSEFEALREALIRLHPTIIIAPIPVQALALGLRRQAEQGQGGRDDHCAAQAHAAELSAAVRQPSEAAGRRGAAKVPRRAVPLERHYGLASARASAQEQPARARAESGGSARESCVRASAAAVVGDVAAAAEPALHRLGGVYEPIRQPSVRQHGEGESTSDAAMDRGRTGQAADAAYIATGHMLKEWEEKFTEPLHEYAQFASILQKLLKWRHLKHLQYELAQDALEAKKTQLEELERVENEARRLEEALERGGAGLIGSGGRVTGGGIDANGIRDGVGSGFRASASVYGRASGEGEGESAGQGKSKSSGDDATGTAGESGGANGMASVRSRAASPPASPSKRSSSRSTGYGLLGAITHTFQSVMDVDRDASRRNNISKLREEIALLEEGVALTSNDLHYATTAIQTDLDRFQRQKAPARPEPRRDDAP
ncbi:hypothetical protein L1887_53953 [Cichorium endivia]|nr:hypothetical protein L1887_53953 [Cichorium endivia]